jgi:pimeloyl-ACP methyl ester carboxylesterase
MIQAFAERFLKASLLMRKTTMTEMTTEVPATPRRVTLLLVHGAGFCRQVWEPLIRRLRASPLLGTGEVSFVAIDLPYHGVHGDASAPARVYYEDGVKDRPRVSHPGNDWVSWSSAAVYKAVLGLQRPNGVVIGIGHSMGAAALWRAETAHPGTFHRLVLFEPIYGPPRGGEDSRPLDFMVDITLKRAAEWCDADAMDDDREAVRTDGVLCV